MNIKKSLSALSALIITFSCASSMTVHADSLISGIIGKTENNAFIHYRELETADGYSYMKIVMNSPNSELEFRNISEGGIPSSFRQNYAGTIEISGDTYLVIRKQPISFNTTVSDLSDGFNDYCFYRICSDEDEVTSDSFFPVYELIEAAQHFGLKTGKVKSVTFDENTYKCDLDVSALKSAEEDAIPYKVYGDISKGSYVLIDNYDYYSPEFYLSMGSQMQALENGCFSLDAKKYDFLLNEKCVDSYVNISFPRTEVYELSDKNDITVDYSISDELAGKYCLLYSFEQSYIENSETRIKFHIAEKISDMDIDEVFKSFETVLGNNHLSLKSYELADTYTVNGHEYDLYKGSFHYYGCVSNYDEVDYVAVRKDTKADDTALENSFSVYEHFSHITNDTAPIAFAFLTVHNCGAEGSFNVSKNDIKLVENEVPEVITGDFNNDRIINTLDIIPARHALISATSDENAEVKEYMDINKSGKFDVADIVMLQSFVIGKTKQFP
ncbi:dockerin type I domain-containing protein [Ruminococcus flavefaciens]|uniref:dockerin type I domain-containing protein n=1 Tax=Ruminococcus flavefaciens TaxID=1265 RepID=UPI0026F31C35|nr:dockerin type I domain-containing protein [Ruminococcus flavefaciens]MDD7515565.1 hypothetical protein [Ruminococcus flavefaciens]MDY5692714.1 hypothetical protein [Ruminococcus flavefaciens]